VPRRALQLAGNDDSLGHRATVAERRREGCERRRRQGDARIEDRIADEVAQMAVEVEARATSL